MWKLKIRIDRGENGHTSKMIVVAAKVAPEWAGVQSNLKLKCKRFQVKAYTGFQILQKDASMYKCEFRTKEEIIMLQNYLSLDTEFNMSVTFDL